MDKAIRVIDLYRALAEEIRKGNASKKILISADEEGNGYNELYYLITPPSEDLLYACFLPCSVEEAIKDYVVLG